MNVDNIYCQYLREADVKKAVYEWWARLVDDPVVREQKLQAWPRGDRALLRRAHTPDDALFSDGFRKLWFALPSDRRNSRDMQAWGCVATVLAEVKTHDPEREFAACLAKEQKSQGQGTGKPCVSELRFAQLQRSNDIFELQRRLRRLVIMVDGKVNVISLADGVLQWHREKSGYFEPRPERRLSVRWATAYFSELARYQRIQTTATN